MRNFVPVEELVEQSILLKILSLNFSDYVVETEIRGLKIKWLCLSKRLLWMAVGHEYIEPELLNWIDSIPGINLRRKLLYRGDPSLQGFQPI